MCPAPGGLDNTHSASHVFYMIQSSEGTEDGDLTLFKYRIWDIKDGPDIGITEIIRDVEVAPK